MPYTIRTITPQYITVNGLNGPETRLAPDGFVPPQSFIRLLWSSADVQLWDDVNGTATLAEIKAQTGILTELVKLVKDKANELIVNKWPLWAQNNCALGIYDSATFDQCKADIAAVITASNTAEDAINNAVSLDAALAVVPAWPVI